MKKYGYFIIFILFALSSAITLTLRCQPLFAWQLQFIDTQSLVGLSREQVLYNYAQLLDYLLFPWVNHLVMSDIPTSTQGAFHFMEVKQLFLVNNGVLIVSAISTLVIFKEVRRYKLGYDYLGLLRIAIWAPIALVLIFSLGFNFWFVQFHHLFFNNDAWLFDPSTDPIISVLPETFFLLCFVMVVAIMECWLIGAYLYCKRQTKIGYQS